MAQYPSTSTTGVVMVKDDHNGRGKRKGVMSKRGNDGEEGSENRRKVSGSEERRIEKEGRASKERSQKGGD